MTITPDATNAGHLILNASQATDLSGSGTLINLKFTIAGTAGQTTPLTFEDYTDPGTIFHPGFRFNAGTPAATTTNGSVSINPNAPTITPTPAQVCANSTGNSAAGPAGATTYAWSIVNGTITSATNIQTITYTAGASGTADLTLVVTNASGCSASNTVNVTINANPTTPTITPTPAQVCANSTGNSAAGPAGATTYAWSIVNGTITSATNIQTITYTAGASGTADLTLVVTNASGCSASNTVNVTINANPTTPTITPSGSATFCDHGTLTSSSATGNQWYKDTVLLAGETNATYNATTSGSYTVQVTDTNSCASAPSAATTVTVQQSSATVTNTNDSGAGSLRQAIADACAGGGTINFDPALTSGGPASITLTSAELAIDKNLTINGPTNHGLTISGNNARRIFNINSGKSLSISNLTIANGKASTGGGILNAGTLTITSSTINNNKTTDGADATGAASGGNGGNGAGIYNTGTGTLKLFNSTISGNQTGKGGNASGSGVGGNGGNGAGIYNQGSVTSVNVTISKNTGESNGLGVNTNNSANGNPGTGSGLFTTVSTVILRNTIVAPNDSKQLRYVLVDLPGGGTTTTIVNSSFEDDVNGTVDSSSAFNLIGVDGGLSGIGDGTNGNKIGANDTPLSPRLNPLADNGGPTLTHLAENGSPVNDGGSNALAKDQNNNDLTTDQRGGSFSRVINGTVDIGAVESSGTPPPPGADLTVTKSVDRDTVVPDRDLTYTIVVSNSGADSATNVSLTDTLPSVTTNSDPSLPTYTSTTFVSLTPAGGWTCGTPSAGSGGTVSCNRASFPGTSNQTFTLVVHVPPSAVANAGDPFISNTVSVDDTNDTNTENNGAFAVTQLFSCFSNPVVTTSADSGVGSLRQSIADACSGSMITFDMTPGHVTSPIALTSGELLVNKDLTIRGPGANVLVVQKGVDVVGSFNKQLSIQGPQRNPIAAPSVFRIFNVDTATVAISGLTIAKGNAASGAAGASNPGANGGGVSNTGILTITNSVINGNQAGPGGNFAGNTGGVGGDGGGIYNAGTLTIINSTISGNKAGKGGGGTTGGVGGKGGGIANTGTLTIVNSTLTGNQAGIGGDATLNGGVGGNGGGIFSNNTATITNCTISGNLSGTGGSATGDGGVNGGNGNGGGINNGAAVNIRNSIIAGNSSLTGPDLNGTFNSQDYNLIGNTSGATLTGTTAHNLINQSANLGALANNGGPTQTMLPLPGSPTINAGDPANLPPDTFDLDGDSNTSEALPVDQRGFARVVGANFDIGAVETNYTITATAGTPQSAVINAAFATALKANVKESGNNQIGFPVTFAAPSSGASGTFTGSATVNTDASGIATAPTFTANGTAGGPYNVVASIGTSLPTVAFALTNTKATTVTAVTASPNPSNSGQSVTFTATVTSTAGTPTGTVQFKDGGTNLGPAQTVNGSGVATFSTSSMTAGIHTITADYSGDANFIASTGTLAGGQQVGAIIRFSSPTYNTTESSRSVTITVQRSGELTSAVTVDYATPDDSAATPTILPCSTPGFVSPRCDFTTAIGTLRFAANETSKTFEVLISQDNFVEGSEQLPLTLSNPSGNAGLGTPSSSSLTIADDVTEPAANPIDDSTNFVRQHYHDFLNREPDPADLAGLNFWVNQIESCGADQACRDLRRQNVSAAFFLSIEFQQTGFYAYRTYKTAFADINPPTVPVPVRYREFVRDTREVQRGVIVGQGAWQAQLDANKQAYAVAFVGRPEFLARYPATTTAPAFVDTLNGNAGNVLSPTERSALISELTPNPADPALRGDVLMKIAENTLLKQQEMNRAFVLMQYFGYLRRNPDAAPEPGLNFSGYNFWLNKLNSFNGNFVNADMVKAFITSGEYRKRSGQ